MQTIPKLSVRGVYRPSNVVLWCLLTSSAGAVNAGSLLACQSFVSHITGTATRIGVDTNKPALMAEYGAVLGSFLVGAFVAPWMLRIRAGRFSGIPVPIATVSALLCVTALLGRHGTFGGFGTGVETPGDFVLLVILSLAMGLQNASTSLFTRNQVRTTHMTGAATDLALLAALFVKPEPDSPPRRELLRDGGLRAASIATFTLGAGAMVLMTPQGYALFLTPAAVLAAAAVLGVFAHSDAHAHDTDTVTPVDDAADDEPINDQERDGDGGREEHFENDDAHPEHGALPVSISADRLAPPAARGAQRS